MWSLEKYLNVTCSILDGNSWTICKIESAWTRLTVYIKIRAVKLWNIILEQLKYMQCIQTYIHLFTAFSSITMYTAQVTQHICKAVRVFKCLATHLNITLFGSTL